MYLMQRSLMIYAIFMMTALIVITFGISIINKSEIERQVIHLVPEFRRSLIGGDNRSVRDVLRSTIRYPLINLEVTRFDGIMVDSQSSAENKALFLLSFETPLQLNPTERSIGNISVHYTLDQSLKNGVFLWLIFLIISYPIYLQFRRNLIRIEQLNTENARSSAIARTTQMLAHDVRKPFSLFRMTIERVKSASNAQQVQSVLQEALPEVERSLANVNGLITDVLNVGGEFKLVLKPVRLAAVVEDVVEEVRKLNPSRTLNVKLIMDSETWVEADDTRLPRVFLNILSNAVEAVNSSSVHLWVSAQRVSQDSLEVRVGNAGSFIEPDAREKLFDLFYTSGKKGGTGLGLAIVKKIIAGHGSTVECLSERSADFPDGKVEFVWSMKRANAPVEAAVSEVQLVSETPATPSTDKPQVVFLDDSPLARWVWDAKLKNQVAFRSFAGPREFWAAVVNKSIVLQALHTIITDHYFAPDENFTGVEFAAALRKQGFKGRILLASSGEFDPQQLAGIVDKIVDKQPTDWDKL